GAQGRVLWLPPPISMHQRADRPDPAASLGPGFDRRGPGIKLEPPSQAQPRAPQMANGRQLRAVSQSARPQALTVASPLAPAYPGSHHLRDREHQDPRIREARTEQERRARRRRGFDRPSGPSHRRCAAEIAASQPLYLLIGYGENASSIGPGFEYSLSYPLFGQQALID